MAREPIETIDQCAAVVLAGGYSTRFGDQDKAIAELDGKPLIRHVVERIAPAVSEVIINCRDEQRNAIEQALSGARYRIAVDPVADRGPVAGIRTGCRASNRVWTFVTACDMPFVDSQLVHRLFNAGGVRDPFETSDSKPSENVQASDGVGKTEGFVPQADGRLQPLAAVYRTTAVSEAADATLEQSSGALMDMLDRLSPVRISQQVSAHAIEDIDTRAELRVARSRSS